MSKITNLTDHKNKKFDYHLDDGQKKIIEGRGLTMLPALIDPHVHFRIPGQEYKEDWQSGAQAALAGGVTEVFDMPNNQPSITTAKLLKEKKKIIDNQLKQAKIPLRYHLYFGVAPNNLKEVRKVKDDIVALKLFMGSSTGNLLVDNKADQELIFKLAAELGLVVAIHAEDESTIKKATKKYQENKSPSVHSLIRNRETAIQAVKQAIELTKKYGTKLYLLHLSTAEEMKLVKGAKQAGLPVFAEVCPHHLFLNNSAYKIWGTKVQINPPLREASDQQALWQAINENIVDIIGTDHAPHTLAEKTLPFGQAPSGIPGIEFRLPLLLEAVRKNLTDWERIIALTRTNIIKIFNLEKNNDQIIVDLNKKVKVSDKQIKSKCGWSPYTGMELTGWPVYTILKNKIYSINN